MATAKKEPKNIEYKIEELNKKISQKNKEVQILTVRIKKEEELTNFHKNKVRKYFDDLKKLESEINGHRMEWLNLIADDKQIDRNKFFEQTMAVAVQNIPKVNFDNKVDSASMPSTKNEEKSIDSDSDEVKSVDVASKEKSEIHNDVSNDKSVNNNINPLEQARAEWAKKNPGGFAGIERSRK